jgi:uncharacterized phage infection (PIP) family protein YhgE
LSEQKPEKKVVSRTVAIALGIIVILIAVGFVAAMMNYTSMINSRDSTIQSNLSQIQTLTNQKNQLQTCLDGNETLLNQTRTWLDGNITSYNSQINSLNSQNTNLQNQISSLNSQVANLQNQISSLNSQITDLNNQIVSLQSQVATLQAPKLIRVNLKSDDNRPFLGTPYLHVYGEVCNVGTNTAYNSKIHVVAYQSGGVVAMDTYIIIGTISGESWTSVNGSPTYSGGALTNWTLTLEWTS